MSLPLSAATTSREFAQLRKLASRQPLLFHGTRYPRCIAAQNRLAAPLFGDQCVSFTRSLSVGIYWATLERDDDEGYGAVLVIDRNALSQRYRIEPRCNGWTYRSEAEEAVWQDVENLGDFLLGMLPMTDTHETRGAA